MRKKTISKTLDKPEKLVCPVCSKEFKVNGDTKYFIRGGYTCSWKCFLNEVRRQDAERMSNGRYRDYKKRNRSYEV